MSLRSILAVVSFGALASGCAGQQQLSCAYPQVDVVAVSPVLAYPIPGSTGVPIDIGTIIYNFGNSDLPIQVRSSTVRLATEATAVPNPLPSPIATELSPFTSYAARSVATLEPSTTYTVGFPTNVTSGCPMVTRSAFETIGSFTTQ